jgi:hypothetical protein
VALVVCALLCALPARALASSTQESILMDDNQFIYSSAGHVYNKLREIKALGVDRVKVSVVWSLVAPNADSTNRPSFDAADPAAYPPGAWARWDRIVTDAASLGLKVYFQLVPPAPAWALATGTPTQGYPWSQKPNASDFGKFVQAVALRYSGTYEGLPKVDYWGIWNEANEAAWLNPQYKIVGGRQIDLAPNIYRRLVDAAYRAFVATGHGSDTILTGELAARGWIYPIPFVRELYCVDSHYRPFTGSYARSIGCPARGDRATFVRRHPGLFVPSFAYHPYSFDRAPNRPMDNPNWITFANIGRLERTLDGCFAAYGKHPRGGVSMYMTEYGYKTDPPNPYVHTTIAEQAQWLNQSDYLAYTNPRVKSVAQFLLVDDKPRAGAAVGSRSYWSTFQTGLKYSDGKAKPAYGAYRLPIWVPDPRHGSRVTVWAELRPADHSGVQSAVLQYRGRGSRRWQTLRAVQTSNREGFVLAHVRIGAAGTIRLAWANPSGGRTYYSRSVSIS